MDSSKQNQKKMFFGTNSWGFGKLLWVLTCYIHINHTFEAENLNIFNSGVILEPTPTVLITGEVSVNIILHETIDVKIFDGEQGRVKCENDTKSTLAQAFSEYSSVLKQILQQDEYQKKLHVINDASPLFADDSPQSSDYIWKSKTWVSDITAREITFTLPETFRGAKFVKNKLKVIHNIEPAMLIEFSVNIESFRKNLGQKVTLSITFSEMKNVSFLVTTLKPMSGTFKINSILRPKRSIKSWFDIASQSELEIMKDNFYHIENESEKSNSEKFKLYNSKLRDFGLIIKNDQALAESLKNTFCVFESRIQTQLAQTFLKTQVTNRAEKLLKTIDMCQRHKIIPDKIILELRDTHCGHEFNGSNGCKDFNFFREHGSCEFKKIYFLKSEVVLAFSLILPTGPKEAVSSFRLHSIPVFNQEKKIYDLTDIGHDSSVIKLASDHLTTVSFCQRNKDSDVCDIKNTNHLVMNCIKHFFWDKVTNRQCKIKEFKYDSNKCFYLEFNHGFIISSNEPIQLAKENMVHKPGFLSPNSHPYSRNISGLTYLKNNESLSFTCSGVILNTKKSKHTINLSFNEEISVPMTRITNINSIYDLKIKEHDYLLNNSFLIPEIEFPRKYFKPTIYMLYGALAMLGTMFIIVIIRLRMRAKRDSQNELTSIPY